jgi:cbb3-type cytochrome oxidase subunit 3
MLSGLILLVFIGALIAYFYSRGRRKIGMPFAGKHWRTIIVGAVLIGVILYAASIGNH